MQRFETIFTFLHGIKDFSILNAIYRLLTLFMFFNRHLSLFIDFKRY